MRVKKMQKRKTERDVREKRREMGGEKEKDLREERNARKRDMYESDGKNMRERWKRKESVIGR
jgi:hypothetical protein